MVISIISCLWIFCQGNAAEVQWPVVVIVGLGAWCLAIGRLWDRRPHSRSSAIYTSFVAAALSLSVLISYFNELPLANRGLFVDGMWFSSHGHSGGLCAAVGSRIAAVDRALGLTHLNLSWTRRWLVTCTLPLVCCSSFPLCFWRLRRGTRLALSQCRTATAVRAEHSSVGNSRNAALGPQHWALADFDSLVFFLWADLPALHELSASHSDVWRYLQRTMFATLLLGWIHFGLSHWLAGNSNGHTKLSRFSWGSLLIVRDDRSRHAGRRLLHQWPQPPELVTIGARVAWLLAWVGLIAALCNLH